MKKQGMLWAGFLLLSTSFAWAQSGGDRVCEINVTTPKPGTAKQFEEARKKHNQFHQSEKDKNSIMIWSITAGRATGSYLTAVCGMTWKEMDGRDAFEKRDEADRQLTMAPVYAANQQSYYIFRQDLSNGTEAATPTKMMTATDYFIKPGGLAQFTDAIKRINAAMKQTQYPAKPSRWYQLAVGGEGPRFVVVTDRASWADMQPPEQTMADMLKKAYGDDDKTLQSLRDAVDHTESQLMSYRGDLSYMPAK